MINGSMIKRLTQAGVDLTVGYKDLQFRNDELLMDNKILKDQLKGIISRNNYLSRSNGQLRRNDK